LGSATTGGTSAAAGVSGVAGTSGVAGAAGAGVSGAAGFAAEVSAVGPARAAATCSSLSVEDTSVMSSAPTRELLEKRGAAGGSRNPELPAVGLSGA